MVHPYVSSLFIEEKYCRLCREDTFRLRHLNGHSSIDAFLHCCPIHPFPFVFVFLYSFLVLELISFYRIVLFFLGISSFLLDSRFLPSFNPNPPHPSLLTDNLLYTLENEYLPFLTSAKTVPCLNHDDSLA